MDSRSEGALFPIKDGVAGRDRLNLRTPLARSAAAMDELTSEPLPVSP